MKMRPASPTKGFSRALGVLSVLAIVSAPPVAAAEPPKFNPPKTYYLALGDSFAYGFTNAKFLAGLPPSAFDTGFVGMFAQPTGDPAFDQGRELLLRGRIELNVH